MKKRKLLKKIRDLQTRVWNLEHPGVMIESLSGNAWRTTAGCNCADKDRSTAGCPVHG